MKRILALILVLALVVGLCACKKETVAETTVSTTESTEIATEPTTEPITVPTEPVSEPGIIRGNALGIVWHTYQRNDKVTVIGKWGDYYILEDAERDHLVEQRFVRLSGEEVAEGYEAWARYNTQVFTSASLTGEPIATLRQNTPVQVIDSYDDWMFIQWKDGSGYVKAERISKWMIPTGGSSSSGSSGGDYGGGSGSGGSSGSSSGGSDGSDVDLGSLSASSGGFKITLLGSYSGPIYEDIPSSEGRILSDNTESYLAFLSRDDTVKVTEVTEEECTLYLGDAFVKIPRWAVRLEGDETYEAWQAYSRWGTKAYAQYQLTGELEAFKTNQKVEVVDEITELGLYIVKLENGFGYVSIDGLSKYSMANGGSSSSNSGGDSDGGGGGSSGGSSSSGGAEWTPPVL